MDLALIQQQMENLYAVGTCHSVTDFLITDRNLAQTLDNSNHLESRPPEQLLLSQAPDELSLSLYIDATVLERLNKDDPFDHLHDGNMTDLCLVLEGISHFIYVVWSATHDRSLTPMELELQAEIDKYVSMSRMFLEQYEGPVPKTLHKWLFENIRFRDNLDTGSLSTYRDANRYAMRYCRHLEKYYFRHRQQPDPSRELRRFYRLNRADKLHRIRATEGSHRL